MNFIKYLTWNIKKYKKLILSIFISILFGFLFSGCEVKAVTITNPNPPTTEYKSYSISKISEILTEIYNINIDLSEYTNTTEMMNYISNGNYGIYITKYRSSIDSTDYLPAIFFDKHNTGNDAQWRYHYLSSSEKQTLVPYTNYFQNKLYIIDYNNRLVNSDNYFSTLASRNNIQKYFVNGEKLVLSTSGVTSEQFFSIDYQTSVFFDFIDWYSGKWYGVENATQDSTTPISSSPINKQNSNKLDYWNWTDDNLNNNYISGDIELFDDYFEVRDFETNITNYSMYLLRYGVIYDQYGGYRVSSGYEWREISKPNQGALSTWQITNLFGNESGDDVYAIGIGTSEVPDLIRSEWFDSDYNISDFMNIDSFRLRYYVEDLPEFFIPTESSGSGDSGIIPSGDDTEIIGGINGIWQAVLNLPNMILDGLVGLFVPSEGFFSAYFDELLTWFEERLGILSYPITFTVEVLNRILDLDFNEPVISWDDMHVPLFEDEVPLIAAGEINFKTLVESNETILNFYNTYLIIVDGLLVFMIIKLIQRKHDEIVGGASE